MARASERPAASRGLPAGGADISSPRVRARPSRRVRASPALRGRRRGPSWTRCSRSGGSDRAASSLRCSTPSRRPRPAGDASLARRGGGARRGTPRPDHVDVFVEAAQRADDLLVAARAHTVPARRRTGRATHPFMITHIRDPMHLSTSSSGNNRPAMLWWAPPRGRTLSHSPRGRGRDQVRAAGRGSPQGEVAAAVRRADDAAPHHLEARRRQTWRVLSPVKTVE